MNPINVSALEPGYLIDKWYEEHDVYAPRPYMGISELGNKCPRCLWLKFHWAVRENFPGRMLRLFKRGQLEEERFVEYLRKIGCTVTDCLDEQCTVDFGGWVKGHPDGIIQNGLPEAPKSKHIVEFKTHNDKSFQELKKKGVKEAKYKHWAQMQCYMFGKKIDRALYLAVNKNDDELYAERVELNKIEARDLIERGQDIASDIFKPFALSKDPTWYECKCCPCYDLCHVTHECKEHNCRTCKYFEATKDEKALCTRLGMEDRAVEIPYEIQVKGCRHHIMNPQLTPGGTW